MPKAKRTPKKALTRDELKQLDAFTVTVRASEGNIQRLAAFLMFADFADVELKYIDTPLPWEDPNDPRFLKPPELQLNRNGIQNALMPLFEAYFNRHGEEKAKEMIKSFGAERLSLLTDTQLLDMYNALAGEAASE